VISHADLREMIAPYALGALDPPDLAAVEEHLNDCAFCANLAREAGEVGHYLSYAAPYRAVPEGGLARLMASIRPSSFTAVPRVVAALAPSGEVPKRRFRPRLPAWLRSPSAVPLAASLLLMLGLTGWNAELMRELHGERDEMNLLHQRLGEQSHLLVMVTSHTAVTRPLESTALAPSAQVRLIMDGDTNSAMLMANRLPPLPPGRVYQVWLGRQGARMPAGRFMVDQQGDGECNLELDDSVHSYDSAWITLEPMKGTPTPNSPGVAKGTL